MKLIDSAKTVLTRSYSAWALYLGGSAEIILEYVLQVGGLPTWAVLLLVAAALVGRVLKQDSVSGREEQGREDQPWGV